MDFAQAFQLMLGGETLRLSSGYYNFPIYYRYVKNKIERNLDNNCDDSTWCNVALIAHDDIVSQDWERVR